MGGSASLLRFQALPSIGAILVVGEKYYCWSVQDAQPTCRVLLYVPTLTFFAGKFNAASYASSSGFTSGPRRGAYSEAAVEELLMEAGAYRRDKGIDVLLTSEWGEQED